MRSKLLLVGVLLVAMVGVAAGAVTIHADRTTVTLQDSNATVALNFTRNVSQFAVHGDTIVLGASNFSVFNGTTDRPVSVELYSWNASAGNQSYAANFSANTTNHNVTFGFDGLVANADYNISRDQRPHQTRTADANGSFTFFNSQWSYRNFSVNRTSAKSAGGDGGDGGGDGGGGSGSGGSSGGSSGGGYSTSSDPSGPQNVTDGRSWANVDAANVTWSDIDEETGITSINIETTTAIGRLSIDVKRFVFRPTTLPPVDGAERYLQFSLEHLSDRNVTRTRITFTVNTSVAARHDRVVMSRYQDGWEDLPTKRLRTVNGTVHYRASASGFSYYAVRGVSTQKEEQNRTNLTSLPVCGDGACESGESWETCAADCPVPDDVRAARAAVQEAELVVPRSSPAWELVEEAQTALDDGKYDRARQLAEDAMRQHRQRPTTMIYSLVFIVLLIVGILVIRHAHNHALRAEARELRERMKEEWDHLVHEDEG